MNSYLEVLEPPQKAMLEWSAHFCLKNNIKIRLLNANSTVYLIKDNFYIFLVFLDELGDRLNLKKIKTVISNKKINEAIYKCINDAFLLKSGDQLNVYLSKKEIIIKYNSFSKGKIFKKVINL